MSNDISRSEKSNAPARPSGPMGACDWCYQPHPVGELTSISGAKLCPGCASYYLGDDDDEDETEKEK
jgi:hypothetical protein